MQDKFPPGERTHQHEEGGFGQVEVCEKRPDTAEGFWGIKKDVRTSRAGTHRTGRLAFQNGRPTAINISSTGFSFMTGQHAVRGGFAGKFVTFCYLANEAVAPCDIGLQRPFQIDTSLHTAGITAMRHFILRPSGAGKSHIAQTFAESIGALWLETDVWPPEDIRRFH